MNTSFSFESVGLWQTAGWTMLHFLWLGTLIGLAALVGRWMLRRAAPNVRYVAALGVLALLAALPVGIAAWLVQNPLVALPVAIATPDGAGSGDPHTTEPVASAVSTPSSAAELSVGDQSNNEIIELSGSDWSPPVESPLAVPGFAGGIPTTLDVSQRGAGSGDPRTTQGDPRTTALTNAMAMLDTAVPYLPWLWLVGTPLTFLLIATGLIGSERLRRASRVIEDGPIADAVARLLQTMRIGRRVTVAVCERIAAPVLVGIVRPIILLPPAALTGWSPDEIEMVLLHELAHVRRWDNLVNLAQRLIESLLFFHPAVWLVSGWVRREREACCDAVVVARTNRPHAYAEMLVALAAQMPRSVLFHPAASSAMAAGPLRGRIRRILQLEEDPMLVSGKSFAMVLGSLVLAATLAVLYLPTLGQAEESAAEELTTESTESTEQPSRDAKPAEAVETPKSAVVLETERLELKGEGGSVTIESKDGAPLRVQPVENLEQDNWPMGVVFPSPKEGEISRRAWEKLGLKLVPATKEELEQAGVSQGVKVVGGIPIPLSRGKPMPLILVGINDTALNEFNDIAKAIDALEKKPEPILRCVLRSNHRFVVFQKVLDPKWLEKAKSDELADKNPQTVPGSSKFPSLEDQKLADLAWKRLGIELESISGDDLKRVQALGYEGGLKVTGTGIELQQLQMQNQQVIRQGDILVGLHVWPTTSLPQVAEVLNREDLAQFNPLKYYVVRLGAGKNQNGAFRQPEEDAVLTGRISVKSDRLSQPMPAPSSAGRPTSSTPIPAASSATYSNTSPWPRSGDPATPPWPTRGNPTSTGTTSQNTPYPQLQTYQQAQPNPQSTLQGMGAGEKSLLVEPSQQRTFIERPLPGPVEDSVETSRTPAAAGNPTVLTWTPNGAVAIDAAVPPTPAQGKAQLRYNGKTFAEWSDAWRTELSAEKRLEAVKALAAFGRAGYGKEATEAILDVAGEYDFDFSEDDVDGKLKETVLDELAPNYRRHLLAEYWVPDMAKRLEKEPKKWTWQAAFLLGRLKTDDPDVIAILQSLAQNGPGEVRSAALGALVRSGQSRDGALRVDDKTRELLATALKSEDQDAVRSALWLLLYYPPNAGGGGASEPQLIFLPELVPLLFHADEGIRKQARKSLRPIEEKDAPPVVQELVAVLADQSRSADHIEAIRALAVMGPKAQSAVPNLRKILAETDADNPLRYAAAVALENIDNANFQKVLDEVLGKELEMDRNEQGQAYFRNQLKVNRFGAGIAAEKKQLVPPQGPGQGGGGFGGGGGGGFF